jgi:alkylation response protein AidB-like acyl-CoA dehydrogenase
MASARGAVVEKAPIAESRQPPPVRVAMVAHIEIENAWSAPLQALQSTEARANSAAFDVAIAKAKASETAGAATAECLQMHGGIGMTDEFDIGLFLKRARVDSVLFGDAAFHTDRVATMLGY